MADTPRTDALAAKLLDKNITGDAAALALLAHAHGLERLLRDVEEDRDARRQSLANEIRGVLKTRGYFAPDRPSDLIGAVAQALDAAKAEGREAEAKQGTSAGGA